MVFSELQNKSRPLGVVPRLGEWAQELPGDFLRPERHGFHLGQLHMDSVLIWLCFLKIWWIPSSYRELTILNQP